VTPDGLVPTAAPGVFLGSAAVESVIGALRSALAGLAGTPTPRSLYAPPVIAGSVMAKVEYRRYFPHLLATVFTADGESDLVLLPAGCYCVYPAYEGVQLDSAIELDVEATCFREERSAEPGRLRSFRMREFVHIGPEDGCRAWRDERVAAARTWLAGLGLKIDVVAAGDAFFGAGSRLLQRLQIEEELKLELVAEVAGGVTQAVASGNYHKDRFGGLFAIAGPGGSPAHSACIAFGYERLALALTHRHGRDPGGWPPGVRAQLGWPARP